MINAMNRAMLVKEEKQTVYKKRGVLWV